MALIYEYMPHGTLDDHLHKAAALLSWLQRLKICIGAARGLDYLHTGPINQTRTHVRTMVKGTFGYMDPCYTYTGKLTRKSDVYSFGVVLLEVMCGRPAVDTSLSEWRGLAPWAQDHLKDGKLNHIVDSRLKGQILKKCLKDFAHIAFRCLDNQRNQRPTMAEIVVKLELIISLQECLDSCLTKVKIIDRVLVFFLDKVLWFSLTKVNSKAIKLISADTSGGEDNATITSALAIVKSGHHDVQVNRAKCHLALNVLLSLTNISAHLMLIGPTTSFFEINHPDNY
uniref:Concanavalin A-like lectin/glucanase, subgroup n=1 Tax=Tanacetum cinerariifolium TaxID=118510 RepID=A0A699JKY5_TANCI|nr:concanavalin A-like lectin/glucanase, subgroup [Tanacetum cinerariifolium]